ncbi:MAG: hypothetical protein AAGM67_22080, partial [Bacteroidota bacterium]
MCNPPYFAAGITPSANARALARHGQSLDFASLGQHASRLASPVANLAVIIPIEREADFREAVAKQDWTIVRRSRLQPHPHKSPHRLMLLASRTPAPLEKEKLLILDAKGEYTEDFR